MFYNKFNFLAIKPLFQNVTVFLSYESTNYECASGTFKCQKDEFCINVKYVCDGFFDCFDRTDEIGCSSLETINSTNRFQCSDKSFFIGLQLVCDFIPDCPDKSDEKDCCK